jgi:hypothetical protein
VPSGRIGGDFGSVIDMAAGPAGELYVVDQRFVRVQVYDSTGAHASTLGRAGRGPGEFLSPRQIAVRDTLVVVSDEGRGQFVYLDPQGMERGAIPMRGGGGHFFDGIGVDREGTLYDGRQGWGPTEENHFVVGLPPPWSSSTAIDTIPIPRRVHPEVLLEGSFNRLDFVEQPLTVRTLWGVRSDGVTVSGNGSRCELTLRSATGEESFVPCAIVPAPVSSAAADSAFRAAELELTVRAENFQLAPATYVRQLRRPEHHARFAALAVDEKDRVWLFWRGEEPGVMFGQALASGADGSNPAWSAVHAIAVEAGLQPMSIAVGGGWMYATLRDSLGVESIVRYRLQPK